MKKLETLTNVVVLAVALLFGTLLVRAHATFGREVPPTLSSRSLPELQGKPLKLTGQEWSQAKVTAVLTLSTTCGFCARSMEFYKQLDALAAREPGLRIVAVFPEPVAVGEAYLRAHAVNASQVTSTTLPSLGVTGTPTILLVKRDGTVGASWVGLLPESEQKKVLDTFTAALRDERAAD